MKMKIGMLLLHEEMSPTLLLHIKIIKHNSNFKHNFHLNVLTDICYISIITITS